MFKWAVIGTGGIAHRFVSVLGTPKYGQLRGVLATSIDKAESFLLSQKDACCGGGRSYRDIDALLDDDAIDAVYIATPHTLHFEFAQQLLSAHIPVLCEKPLTVTADEARVLANLSEQNRVFLMEALWTKTLPVWHRVKQLLDSNIIGKVDHYSADIGFYFPYDKAHRLYDKNLAGGILLDMGVYPISMANWLSGVPCAIQATSIFSDEGVDLKTMINMTFANQLTASFTLTTASTTENAFWIYGRNGTIRVDNLFSAAQGLMYDVGRNKVTETYPFEINGFEYQIREAVECIVGGAIEHPSVTHQNTLDVMTIVDQIREKVGLDYS